MTFLYKKLTNSFIGNGKNENIANILVNKDEYYLDFLNNLYDKILKEKKNHKNNKCGNCGRNLFFKGKNIYNICPEILIISFDIKIDCSNKVFLYRINS